MSGETWLREFTNNQNVIDMANAGIVAVLGCDMAQTSALYLASYAASAGSVMNVLLAEKGAGQEFNVTGGTQIVWPRLNLGVQNTRSVHTLHGSYYRCQ
jgi:hypothetical protein